MKTISRKMYVNFEYVPTIRLKNKTKKIIFDHKSKKENQVNSEVI